MNLKDIINTMCIKGTAAKHRLITIKTKDKILFEGKNNNVPQELLNQGWGVLDINPDRSKIIYLTSTPEYNLPYIINVF